MVCGCELATEAPNMLFCGCDVAADTPKRPPCAWFACCGNWPKLSEKPLLPFTAGVELGALFKAAKGLLGAAFPPEEKAKPPPDDGTLAPKLNGLLELAPALAPNPLKDALGVKPPVD